MSPVAIQLADGRTVPRAALFIQPALRPHPDGPAAALGCELLAGGLVTAAGEGSAVAIAINTDLVQDDVDTAMHRLAAANAA